MLFRMDSSYLRRATSDCIPPTPTNTLTSHLNNLLNSSGPGYILSLCPGQTYPITAPLLFTAANQEISTAGYPTGSDRAILLVNGPPLNHSTAVAGNCANCDGVKFRNVQVKLCFLGNATFSRWSHADSWSKAGQTTDRRRGKYRDGWSKLKSTRRVRQLH